MSGNKKTQHRKHSLRGKRKQKLPRSLRISTSDNYDTRFVDEILLRSKDSCLTNPNFGIITDFLVKFTMECGLIPIPFKDLQLMLEAKGAPHSDLVLLHCQLLRKLRLPRIVITKKTWERALVIFCSEESNLHFEGLEIKSQGYAEVSTSVKLEVLRNLMEAQFLYNDRLKDYVDNLPADEELRDKSCGRDLEGQIYWSQLSEFADIRIYQEDSCFKTWNTVAQTREDLSNLLGLLKENKIYKEEESRIIQAEKEEEDRREFEAKMLQQSESNPNHETPKASIESAEMIDVFVCQICPCVMNTKIQAMEHYSGVHLTRQLKEKFPHLVKDSECKLCHFNSEEEDVDETNLIWIHVGTIHEKIDSVLKEEGLKIVEDTVEKRVKPTQPHETDSLSRSDQEDAEADEKVEQQTEKVVRAPLPEVESRGQDGTSTETSQQDKNTSKGIIDNETSADLAKPDAVLKTPTVMNDAQNDGACADPTKENAGNCSADCDADSMLQSEEQATVKIDEDLPSTPEIKKEDPEDDSCLNKVKKDMEEIFRVRRSGRIRVPQADPDIPTVWVTTSHSVKSAKLIKYGRKGKKRKTKKKTLGQEANFETKTNDERIENRLSCKKCNTWQTGSEAVYQCESCQYGWHSGCVIPPLNRRPGKDWICPLCDHRSLIVTLEVILQELDLTAAKENERRLTSLKTNRSFSYNRGDEDDLSKDAFEDDLSKEGGGEVETVESEMGPGSPTSEQVDQIPEEDDVSSKGRRRKRPTFYGDFNSGDEEDELAPHEASKPTPRAFCTCNNKGRCPYCRMLMGCTCHGAGTCRLCSIKPLRNEDSEDDHESDDDITVINNANSSIVTSSNKIEEDDDVVCLSDEESHLSTSELYLLKGKKRTLYVPNSEKYYTSKGKPRKSKMKPSARSQQEITETQHFISVRTDMQSVIESGDRQADYLSIPSLSQEVEPPSYGQDHADSMEVVPVFQQHQVAVVNPGMSVDEHVIIPQPSSSSIDDSIVEPGSIDNTLVAGHADISADDDDVIPCDEITTTFDNDSAHQTNAVVQYQPQQMADRGSSLRPRGLGMRQLTRPSGRFGRGDSSANVLGGRGRAPNDLTANRPRLITTSRISRPSSVRGRSVHHQSPMMNQRQLYQDVEYGQGMQSPVTMSSRPAGRMGQQARNALPSRRDMDVFVVNRADHVAGVPGLTMETVRKSSTTSYDLNTNQSVSPRGRASSSRGMGLRHPGGTSQAHLRGNNIIRSRGSPTVTSQLARGNRLVPRPQGPSNDMRGQPGGGYVVVGNTSSYDGMPGRGMRGRRPPIANHRGAAVAAHAGQRVSRGMGSSYRGQVMAGRHPHGTSSVEGWPVGGGHQRSQQAPVLYQDQNQQQVDYVESYSSNGDLQPAIVQEDDDIVEIDNEDDKDDEICEVLDSDSADVTYQRTHGSLEPLRYTGSSRGGHNLVRTNNSLEVGSPRQSIRGPHSMHQTNAIYSSPSRTRGHTRQRTASSSTFRTPLLPEGGAEIVDLDNEISVVDPTPVSTPNSGYYTSNDDDILVEDENAGNMVGSREDDIQPIRSNNVRNMMRLPAGIRIQHVVDLQNEPPGDDQCDIIID